MGHFDSHRSLVIEGCITVLKHISTPSWGFLGYLAVIDGDLLIKLTTLVAWSVDFIRVANPL